MKNIFIRLSAALFNKQLDLRVRLFNILAMTGIIVSFSATVISFITGSGIEAIPTSLLSTGIAAGLLYFSYRSGRYQLCYMLTIVVVFLILFSIIFFIAGGYHSAMPLYFIFAFIFTVFMLDGKKMFIMAAVELTVYSSLCLFAYHYPQYIIFYDTEWNIVIDIITGLFVVGISLGATMVIQFKLYNEQSKELEEARQRLSEENAALEHLSRMKTEFLANISHELKTPLTVMSGYAQISDMQLSDRPENIAVHDKMKIISSEAERLALMVGQILDVTRIEEGRMNIDLKSCNIDEIIQSAVDTYFPILNKNSNKLRLEIESELPRICADTAQITQVIVNLVANAIRFTVGGMITIAAHRCGAFVEVSVTDTGRGIEPEKLPYIFDRYNRGESYSDTGTGLGLYICKHIIDKHNGVITAESEVGTGSTLSFTVPIIQ